MILAVYQSRVIPNLNVGGFVFEQGWLTLSNAADLTAFMQGFAALDAATQATVVLVRGPGLDYSIDPFTQNDSYVPVPGPIGIQGIPGPIGPIGPQGNPGGTYMSIGSFMSAPNLIIPVGTDLVRTSGYAIPGIGPADYVSDAQATQALLTQFPNCCFKSQNGRIFRLVANIVYTVMCGAVGIPGTNDQPAIQQALGYANAVGIETVKCSHTTYEMWCPIRTPNANGYDTSGIPMVISQNLHFDGVGGGTTFNLKNSLGGEKTVITQTGAAVNPDPTANYNWLGGGIYVKPAGAKMDWVTVTNIHMEGGTPYVCASYESPSAAERAALNLTDKGFRIQDTEVDLVTIHNCTFRNFCGEVYYIGGNGVQFQDIQDSTFEGSPQCSMNPGSAAGFYFRNLKAGKSYQNEMLGGSGGIMRDCKFYDMYSMFISGGPDGNFEYSYAYPVRKYNIAPPFVDLSGSRFERVGQTSLTSYCIGDITTVDGGINLQNTGRLSDINLRIQAWADLGNGFEAVTISGPQNLTTQVDGAPIGVYVETPRNIRVEVTCHRTGYAMSKGNTIKPGVRIYGGLIDPSCQFIIDGEMETYWDMLNTPPAGFAFPRIDMRDTVRTPDGNKGSSNVQYVNADFTVNLTPGAIDIQPQGGGNFNFSATAKYPLAIGQRVKIFNNAPMGRTITIPANPGGGISLSGTRILEGNGSFLELEQQANGVLTERGFSTQHVGA